MASISDNVGKLLNYANLWAARFTGDQTARVISEGVGREKSKWHKTKHVFYVSRVGV